jgi:hypothetical protein
MTWSSFRRPLVAGVVLLAATVSLRADEYTVLPFAGSGGGPSYRDAAGASARFKHPRGVAVAADGTIYVTDYGNHLIRVVTSAGQVSTLAGWLADAVSYDGDARNARFDHPYGITIDSDGDLLVLDRLALRKVRPDGSTTTVALTWPAGLPLVTGATDLEFDGAGNLFVADRVRNLILKILPDGTVINFAGEAYQSGSADGDGATARFMAPSSIAIDAAGNVFVGDEYNYTIRKITPAGQVTTFAGASGNQGTADGVGANARFQGVRGMVFDAAGLLWITDGSAIRKVSAAGAVATVAGDFSAGFADGTGTGSRFDFPVGIAMAPNGDLIIADYQNNAIRALSPSTKVVRTLAGIPSSAGSADGAASDARFNEPKHATIDPSGNLFLADSWNMTVRKITPEGIVSTLAGRAGVHGSQDGPPSTARFGYVASVCSDANGSIYVGDSNHTIRKVTAAGQVSTVAGVTGVGGSGDGPALSATLFNPTGLTFDSTGNLYFITGHAIRKLSTTGMVTTIAGLFDIPGYANAGGSAARFDEPGDLAWRDGYLYVADRVNHRIRRLSTSTFEVTTFAGSGNAWNGDGTGTVASIHYPESVTFDGGGNLLVAASLMIRKITPGAVVTTVAGDRYGVTAGTGSAAEFWGIGGLAYDFSRNRLYITDWASDDVRVAVPAIADEAIVDRLIIAPGQTAMLDTSPQTATEWEWSIVRRPPGAGENLIANSTSRAASFVAAATGWYTIQLRASGPGGIRISTIDIDVVCDEPITAASISFSGAASVCSNSSGGTATVSASGGGTKTYRWGLRNVSGGAVTDIAGATGTTFTLDSWRLGVAGDKFLVCTVQATCGMKVITNEIPITVTQPPDPTISTSSSVYAHSTSNVASVTAVSGASYEWTIFNGTFVTSPQNSTVIWNAGVTGLPTLLGVTIRKASCTRTSTKEVTLISPVSPVASFYTVQPCRIIDTRQSAGPNGGPAVGAMTQRTVQVGGGCGIPSTARSVSLNVTIVPPWDAGHLTIWPADGPRPLASTINYAGGKVRANNAIIRLSPDGALNVFNGGSDSAHFIIDVNGYFE